MKGLTKKGSNSYKADLVKVKKASTYTQEKDKMYKTISTVSLDSVKLQLRSDSTESFCKLAKTNTGCSDVVQQEDVGVMTLPMSCEEMLERMPELLKSRLIEDVFTAERFFALSLQDLSEQLVRDSKANHLIVSPIGESDFQRLSAAQRRYLVEQLKNIAMQVQNLHGLILEFNENLSERYNSIISNLKLTILLNVKKFSIFENSRIMFDSLHSLKELFSSLDFHSLHDLLDEINDCIFEYNHSIDEFLTLGIEPPSPSAPTGEEPPEGLYKCLINYVYTVESGLNCLSPFVTRECGHYMEILDEVKCGFGDFFEQFKKFITTGTVGRPRKFCYDILLFDDHLKSGHYWKSVMIEKVKA